jgi:hypothetical protein
LGLLLFASDIGATSLIVGCRCLGASRVVPRVRWPFEQLAGELVRLTAHDSISWETVRRRLAENELKPWRKDMWRIPQGDGEYVARMEDVLDLYAEAPDPKRPVICFDESPTQLIGEVRQPIPATPGQLERYDSEYRHNGTARLLRPRSKNHKHRARYLRPNAAQPGRLVPDHWARTIKPDLSGCSSSRPKISALRLRTRALIEIVPERLPG